MTDLTSFGVFELSSLLEKGEISSVALTNEFLNNIRQKNGELNAFITICEKEALIAAEESDNRRRNGERLGPLDGIPYSLKDNIVTKNIPTTCGSKMLFEWIPPYDSTVYSRLKTSGAVLLGKNNMDEFAMGSSTATSFFGAVSNPCDNAKVAGGSSGGSAAAVASGMAAFSLGSDTGGSIRQPCSFCGAVGLKPTYGRVSRYGLIAFSSSLDQIGTVTKKVRDIGYIMDVIAGYDISDSTSSKEKCDFTYTPKRDLKNLTVAALDPDSGRKYMSDEVYGAYKNALYCIKNFGADINCYDFSFFNDIAVPVYYIISSAEASSNLARYDGMSYGYKFEPACSVDELYEKTRQYGFGDEAKRRIMLGTFVLSAGHADEYYKKADEMRGMICSEFDKIFSKNDIIITPSAPVTAYTKEFAKGNTLKKYADDIFTSPVNLAGLPAISVPINNKNTSMPIGLQIIGNKFSEKLITDIAGGIEDEI